MLSIALLSEGTSLQKRSGMARVVERFHSFTCAPTRLSANGTPAFAFPADDPRGMEGWVGRKYCELDRLRYAIIGRNRPHDARYCAVDVNHESGCMTFWPCPSLWYFINILIVQRKVRQGTSVVLERPGWAMTSPSCSSLAEFASTITFFSHKDDSCTLNIT